MKIVQLIITGRVQGVYFRAYTQKQATKLGVSGYVCNKANGAVEVIACAPADKLERFINGCYKGPLLAKVKEILVNDKYVLTETFTQFEIR
ncbi:MAG: acylphosphatase [Methylococcales bacterium]